jgi:uncharacterized phage protein (TIGR01671 family)
MREYLFRGKRVDNSEWVYGSPIFQDNYVLIRFWNSEEFEYEEYLVVPESVGEWTGIHDKNGKKIFEDDIVRTQPFSDRPYSKKAKFKQHIGVVEYLIRHFKNSLYEQDYEANWRVNIKDYCGYGCYDWSAFFKCEVIGNVFDNADLLEE